MVNILGSAARGFDRVYGVLSEGTGVRSWLPLVLTTWFQGSTLPGQFVAFFNFLEIIANNTNPVQPPAQPNTPNQYFNNFINNVMQGFQAQQAGNQPFIIP
jgi:hypothetical protein